jgi:hypothetical protein
MYSLHLGLYTTGTACVSVCTPQILVDLQPALLSLHRYSKFRDISIAQNISASAQLHCYRFITGIGICIACIVVYTVYHSLVYVQPALLSIQYTTAWYMYSLHCFLYSIPQLGTWTVCVVLYWMLQIMLNV